MRSFNREPGVARRTVFTFLGFVLFGVGALFLSLLVLPLIHLIHTRRDRAQRSSRNAVRGSFRLLIRIMRAAGVIDHQIIGDLRLPPGSLIIANHPSLIDVVFIVAFLPDAHCVVKEALGRNLFTTLVMRMTGYPVAVEPDKLIDRCTELLESGARIIMFPEGTRTVPGGSPVFRRGAVNLLCRARCPLIPVYVSVTPPALAKGEPWFRVPQSKIVFRLEVGEPYQACALVEEGVSIREMTRRCTERLQKIYTDRLSNKMGHVSQTRAFAHERPSFEPPADP